MCRRARIDVGAFWRFGVEAESLFFVMLFLVVASPKRKLALLEFNVK